MLRRLILSLSLITILTACQLTKKMWVKEYEETFRQFLVSRDGKNIAFLGAKYHYVFTDNTLLIDELLRSEIRNQMFINIYKTHLKVDQKNQVSGEVVVEVIENESLFHEEIHSLEALGFKNNEEGNLAITLKISGTRYNAANWMDNSLPKLNRTYILKIRQQDSTSNNIAKIAATPITIGADAVILLGKTILIPFLNN